MEMARKALVSAVGITVLLLASATFVAGYFGPGFGLNGLPSGWGPLTTSLGVNSCGSGGPICGSGVLGTPLPAFGVGTIPSCAIAGKSYAGSPGVYCAGFPPFGYGVPVPATLAYPVPVSVPAPVPCMSAPVCAPAIAPACDIGVPAANAGFGLSK
jgi:hypothetical protein